MTDTDDHIREYFLKAKEGDSEAFAYIYTEYFTPIWRYILTRTKNREDADELTQDVFVKAYKSIERFNLRDVSPLAYFYTIARNVVIDWRRKKRDIATDEELLALVPDDGITPAEWAVQEEGKALLAKALPELTDGVREVIELRFLQELSTEEIAKKLGKSEGAIRQLQMRGLQHLRKILKQHA